VSPVHLGHGPRSVRVPGDGVAVDAPATQKPGHPTRGSASRREGWEPPVPTLLRPATANSRLARLTDHESRSEGNTPDQTLIPDESSGRASHTTDQGATRLTRPHPLAPGHDSSRDTTVADARLDLSLRASGCGRPARIWSTGEREPKGLGRTTPDDRPRRLTWRPALNAATPTQSLLNDGCRSTTSRTTKRRVADVQANMAQRSGANHRLTHWCAPSLGSRIVPPLGKPIAVPSVAWGDQPLR